ncbi:MAG: nucleotidyltransferase family protein [Deltaproteobacteria bacterium]
MTLKEKKISVILLAAGKSERMGKPKLSLRFNEKKSFTEKIIETILEIKPSEFIVVVNGEGRKWIESINSEIFKNVKIVSNEFPDFGRFYSLKCGLKYLLNKEYVMIFNVDNPFIKTDLCLELQRKMEKCDFIYPVYNGTGGHPLLINENVVNAILKQRKNDINLKEFLRSFKKNVLNVSDKSILNNINTPGDYIRTMSACSDQMDVKQ